MKHLIIGTAGHVDHGKTALIKALTDVDCDTHKEEKKRGITINLGFTHFTLPTGEKVGIIDVPGHKDFIHTMVSGASGIDLVLLVIAADSGIMPQTVEHLNILEILGIKKGIVVLTKIDLIDDDLLELAYNEMGTLLKDTFLENAPVVEVSSVTGAGIDKLKDKIAKTINETDERKKGDFFRMFVDRIFTVKGFGSVVTGTVINGELDHSRQIFLLPGDKIREFKVRRIEKYGMKTDRVVAGDRAAVNIAGLDRNELIRGMIISDKNLKSTKIFDAKLALFNNGPKLNLWSKVIFLCGTFESQARVHLLNSNELRGGEYAAVQVHLDKPCVLIYKDRFIIRNTSGDETLGGGEILDAFPLHHRRRPPELMESVSKLAEGSLSELIRIEVKKRLVPVDSSQIAGTLNKPADEIYRICTEYTFSDIEKYFYERTAILIDHQRDIRYYNRIISNIKAYHKKNPIFPYGLTTDELRGKLGLSESEAGEHYIDLLLIKIKNDGHIDKKGNTWIITDHKITVPGDVKRQIDMLESKIRNYNMQTPLMSELEAFASMNKIPRDKLKQYLKYLVNDGKLYYIEDNYIHTSIADKCRKELLYDIKDGKGITIAEFRNLINGNRKICLLLMALFDKEEIIVRKDDYRYITEKGKKLLK